MTVVEQGRDLKYKEVSLAGLSVRVLRSTEDLLVARYRHITVVPINCQALQRGQDAKPSHTLR